MSPAMVPTPSAVTFERLKALSPSQLFEGLALCDRKLATYHLLRDFFMHELTQRHSLPPPPPIRDPDRWLTVAEAAKQVGLRRGKLYEACRVPDPETGEPPLRSAKFGHTVKVQQRDLDAYVEARRRGGPLDPQTVFGGNRGRGQNRGPGDRRPA